MMELTDFNKKVLFYISNHQGKSKSEISRGLNTGYSYIHAKLKKIEKHGLIEDRDTNTKNSSIFLTNKGMEMVEGLKKMERIIEEE